jgi:hypothetical protein
LLKLFVSNSDELAHLDVLLHALKVEPDGLLVKVGVLLDLEARVLGDRGVVTPWRGGEVDGLGVGVESGLETRRFHSIEVLGRACDARLTRKAVPIRRAPVPEMDWATATLPSLMGLLSLP